MTITVVANPTSRPPRFQITVATPGGQPITAITVSRTVNGATEPTRFQAPAGPSPRTVNDYEAPWGAYVSYSATVTYGATTETYTSSVQVLNPPFPWLLHPTTPGLSRCLDSGDFDAMGVVSIGAVTRAATTTTHEIMAAKYPLVTKTGPRAASKTQLVIATVTAEESSALWSLLDDQTPLLIRVPAGWQWDWEDGYYDVGDVSADKFAQYGPERRRVFTLALQRVEAPAGDLQPERTWNDVRGSFGTWNAVRAAYATWTDVLTDTRR